MATLSASAGTARAKVDPAIAIERRHRILLALAICVVVVSILFLAIIGFPYYTLRLEDRPFYPLHSQLRSSGYIGIRLAFVCMVMFVLLALYPIRKRWVWLSRIGNTRHWLNFHILLGIATPLLITFHTAFRTHGIAGIAYWTMVAVAVSGFVGRYVYAKIPRSLTSVELSMSELDAEAAAIGAKLRDQKIFRDEDLAPLLSVPTQQEIRRMSLIGGLLLMLRTDLARPFQVSRLRRRALGGSHRIATLGGLLASHDANVESVVSIISRQSRLRAAIAFLDRTERIFHLWHVVHRPFSISFAILIVVHIAVALSMGARSWMAH
jgi:hypothetical protein